MNVAKLPGLSGSNPVLGKQLAINAAIILFIVYGGNIVALYDKCFDALKSGAPINKLREFVSRTGGNVSHFDKLLLASKSLEINDYSKPKTN